LGSKLTSVLYFVILIHLLLPILEEPATFQVPFWLPCIIEIGCLAAYIGRWLHARSFQPLASFNSDKKNYVALTIIVLILLDIIQFIVVHMIDGASFKHRYTRFLRILIYINFNEGKELRRAMRNVRKTLPDILNVFALFLISLLIFAFLAWQLFRGKKDSNGKILTYYNGLSYFQSYEDSVWDLYVAVTTANFPDVM
jgi:two pore calcium channel protein 3